MQTVHHEFSYFVALWKMRQLVRSTATVDRTASFLAQERVYTCKHDWNLRRTHKFDPVAAFYVYDLVIYSLLSCSMHVSGTVVDIGDP